MKNVKLATTLIAALMLTSVAGCVTHTNEQQKESVGEYVDDATVTTRVKAAILADPSLKVTEINVETFKGVVQLSGFVASPDTSAAAARVASGVKGVKSVKNDIHVK
jgi:osmotically-inducible protein OsmY